MKIKPILVAVPVMFTLLTGCASDSQNPNLSSLWPFKHGRILGVASNGEIIQELISINKSEIMLTKFAQTHASCLKMKRFAATLHKEHTQNLHKVQHVSHHTGIAPVMNSVSTNIEYQSQRELNELKALRNTDFDRAFIIDTINDHRSALQIIDSAITQSTSAELTTYLKTTRDHVAMHLRKAEALQKELNLY